MQSLSHRVVVSKLVSQTESILNFAPFFHEFVPTPSHLIKQQLDEKKYSPTPASTNTFFLHYAVQWR